jgi:hypothetical protein
VDDNGFLIWLAVFVGTIVAMVYLVTPLVLWARRSFPARPPLRRFELSGVDRPTAEYLARHATDLLTLGFDEPAHFRMSELNDTTTSYFILAVDLDAGTVDGGQVATSNLAVPVLFIRPETVALQVPSVESAAELLALHRAAVARHPLDGRPVLYESGREAEYLDQYYFRQTYDEGVRRGTFRYRESADEYRLTLPGAFAMVWANLPPLKWLHARRLRSEDRRVLAEYGEAR